MAVSTEEQLKIVEEGAEEIIPHAELRSKLEESVKEGKSLRIKYGVDPTAPDLHLGHAVPLRKLRQFQDLGHTVTLLIGDFTALVGDPSARSATRPQLTAEEVKVNAQTYTEQAFKILDEKRTVIDYNSRWFSRMDFGEVLRLAAQFTVARLLERDDFSQRYQKKIPIGLHEFLYPVMQGYDSVVLKSDVELGGTDQKFNMLAGRDLQRIFEQEPQVVITMPLLEGTDGVQKMSKSLGNHVALTDPPEEIFGKVMSIPDELMVKYFKLTTTLSPAEVKIIEKGLSQKKLHPGQAKRRLAREIVALYYNNAAAKKAERVFDIKHKVDYSDAGLRVEVAQEVLLPAEIFKGGKAWIIKVLLTAGLKFDLSLTNSAARRLIEQRSIKLNGKVVKDADLDLLSEELDGKLLEMGKRRVAKLRVEQSD